MQATRIPGSVPPPRIDTVILRLIDRLSGLVALFAALALGLLVITVFVDVMGRTFFRTPLSGTLEMTAYWWMPMITLLSFGFTERAQEHIKVTILLDALPLRLRQIVEGTFALLAAALLLALAWYALQEALYAASIGKTTPSRPPIAIWPFTFVAVAGVTLLALQVAATSYRCFAGLTLKH